jgi:exopolysaccharide production protein ExoY
VERLRSWAASTTNISATKYVPSRSQIRQAPRETLKRIIDFSGALVVLLLASPLLVIVGCVLILRDGRPILFRHKRIGRGGQIFYCLKFRTMVQNSNQVLLDHLATNPAAMKEWVATRKLKEDPRVTKVGAFLRKSSLDEVPQFINVLKGEMSLVGPRPIVRDEVVYYGDRIADYERVKPGLTGPWQIGGRSDLSYKRRVDMDCEYASGLSLRKDLWILLRTIPAVLKSNGSY